MRKLINAVNIYGEGTLLLVATPAFACTLCNSTRAEQVRAAVFGPDFWLNAGLTVLPFVICLGITALIYYWFPGRKRNL